MQTFTAIEMQMNNSMVPGIMFATFEEGQACLAKLGLVPESEPKITNDLVSLQKQSWTVPKSLRQEYDENDEINEHYDDYLFRGKLCLSFGDGGPGQPDRVELVERRFGKALYHLEID